jgi:hypothetical protein
MLRATRKSWSRYSRPLAAATTNRIRLKETYADAKSLYLDGGELVSTAFGGVWLDFVDI